MIIKIDISPIEASNIDHSKLSEFLTEATRASLLGYHRIVISRKLSKWCADYLDLSEKHKSHIERLGQKYTQLGGQVSAAKYKVIIKPDANGVVNIEHGTWIISLDEALSGNYFHATSLILENAKNDGDFYKLLLEESSKRMQFGDISFEVCNGGGNGCAQEIERISGLKKIIACICDTDLKAPEGAKSATYNSAMAAFNRSKPIGVTLGTPGSEIENFLPPSIVRAFTDQNEAMGLLERLIDDQDNNIDTQDCMWLYFDIKSGFPAGYLDKYCKDKKNREWISKKYQVSEDKISSIDFPPLGEKVLSMFMNSNEFKNDFHRHIWSDYWNTHIMDWTILVLWILAGRKKERVS